MESFRLKTILLALILAMASGGAWLFGQAPQGQVLGSVVDSTGAAVPGATVILTNEATGVQTTTVTTSAGDYTFVYLDPGTYTVTVQKEGFDTGVYAGNKVQVLEKKRVDVQLKVGQLTTKVEVTGAAAKVDTDTAAVAATVSDREMTQLPLNGREYSELAVLMPGVHASGTTGQCGITAGLTFATDVQISGGSGYGCAGGGSNKYSFDGVDNTWTLVGGPAINPSVDAIQEFRIDRTQMQAEFGMGANQIEIVTKSGGNKFHGALWEYNRNSATQAGNYYTHTVAPLNRNQYGGNIGGPIKKDKAFFFFNWEGQKQVSSAVEQGTVLTPKQRQGDLSEFLALGSSYQMHDPFTGAAYANNAIPQAQLNAVSLSLMNTYMPLPTLPGLVSNYLSNFPIIDNWHQGIARVDYNPTTKDRLNLRFAGEPRSPLAAGLTATSEPAEAITYYVNAGIAWERTWTSSTLSEIRLGYSDNKVDVGSVPRKQWAPLQPYAPGAYQAVPGYLWMNPFGVQMSSWWYPEDYYMHSFDFVANLTQMRGAHTMKFGFERRTHNWNNTLGPGPKQELAFNGQYTGIGVGDFLEGWPDESNTEGYGNFVNRANLGAPWTDFYAQDDWKVNSHLTLNLGLRWDLIKPHGGRNNLMTTFDLANGKVVVAGNQLSPQYTNKAVVAAYPNDFTTAAAVGWPTDTMISMGKRDFSPRIGFAWRPWKGNKTVVRGGYGIFYQATSDVNDMYYQIQSPYEDGANSMVNTKPFPTRSIADPYALLTGGTAPIGRLTDFYWDPHQPWPSMQQANLGMEHELPWGLILEGNLQYQHTIHLENGYNWNESKPGQPNVIPYPDFTTEYDAGRLGYVNDAYSRYYALELEVRKIARNYTFMLSNVWAKQINGAPMWPSVGDIWQGPGGYIPDELKANFVVDVPMGKGRKFLDHGGVVDAVLGGWETASIMILHQGGNPLTVSTYNSYVDDNLNHTGRPDRVCSGRVSNPTITNWINSNCFVAPTGPSWGNAGTGIIYGPGRSMLGDWSLYKNFTLPFREQMKLQIRGEFFNVFNHPYWNDPSTSWPSPGVFGTITSKSLTPRVVQFAGRLTF